MAGRSAKAHIQGRHIQRQTIWLLHCHGSGTDGQNRAEKSPLAEAVIANKYEVTKYLTWNTHKSIDETKYILGFLTTLNNEIQLDLTLARGLSYYTGAIFEVKALDTPMGSISGGGRYDNLTGIFGMPGLSGVGISFGVDRIYDVLNALDLYPKDSVTTTQLLFINFGEKETAYCLPIINKVRAQGIRAEIFPDAAKMKKQMSYANAKQIPFVALAGENEMTEGKVTLKNMETGEQLMLTPDELIEKIK